MTDPDHQIMTCVECLTEFEVPGNDGGDGHSRCPVCGRAATPGEGDRERVSIPIAKKSLNLDLPQMVITNAHGTKLKGKGQVPPPKGLRNTESRKAGKPESRKAGPKHSRQFINWETQDSRKETPQPAPETVDPNPKTRFKKAHRKHKYPAKLWIQLLLAATLSLVAALAILSRDDRKHQGVAPPNGIPSGQEITKVRKPAEEKAVPVQESAPPGPIQNAVREHGVRGIHEQASAAVRHFLEAGTLDERKTFTRSLQRVGPLMDRYYKTRNPGPVQYQSLTDQHNSRYGKDYYIIGVTLEDLSMAYAIIAIEQDRFLIDWESFVGYSEMSLGRFKEEKPVSPTLFRLLVKPDDYYNFNFTAEDYQCLNLTDMNKTTVIYGYVLKGQGPMSSLQPGQEEFFTLRLRYPENPEAANQVIIDEVITSGWVIE